MNGLGLGEQKWKLYQTERSAKSEKSHNRWLDLLSRSWITTVQYNGNSRQVSPISYLKWKFIVEIDQTKRCKHILSKLTAAVRQPPSIPLDLKCWNRYFELKQLCLTLVLIIRFVHVRWTLSEFGFLIFKRKLDSRYQNIWHSDFKLRLFNLKRYHKTKISQGYIQRSAFGHLILSNFN